MSSSKLTKFIPWAFLLASITFLPLMGSSDAIAIPSSLIGTVLLAAGMLGIDDRYRAITNPAGRKILLVGSLAAAGIYTALILSTIMFVLIKPDVPIFIVKGGWIVLFVGPVILLIDMIIYGIVALRPKELARLSRSIVFTSIWNPAFFIIMSIYIFTHHGTYPYMYQSALNIMHLMQFITLCLLGISLLIEKSREISTAPSNQPVRPGVD